MAGYGVGGAIAGGIQSGFEMGRQLDADQERRAQTARNNQRQDELDAERRAQIERTNTRQDQTDALAAITQEISDHAVTGAGLAQQYGGVDKIPQDVAAQYVGKARDLSTRRATMLRERYEPIVKKEQQWAQDTASRIATGQMSMDDLSPAETVRMIQGTTGRPVGDFLRPAGGGNSKVGQGVADTTAGIQTKNDGLMLQGTNNLLGPEINLGVGHMADDGSTITSKQIVGFVPAPSMQAGAALTNGNPIQSLTQRLNQATGVGQPQPGQQPGQPPQMQAPQQPQLQPGQDPDKVIPVLQVTAQHPDGTEVSYHAPITAGRSTDPEANVAPAMSISGSMDRMGRMSTLEAWANTPAARAKIEQGLKDMGGEANNFVSSYYAMHRNADALLPEGQKNPTGQRIKAIQDLAKSQGISFEDAARILAGRSNPLQTKLDAIDDDDSLTPDEKRNAKRVAVGLTKVTNKGAVANVGAGGPTGNISGGVGGAGKAAVGPMGSPALGNATAPDPKAAHQQAVRFWAMAVLAGDKDWQVGLARGKEGTQLITDVKTYVPQLAAELGIQPSDIGTARAQAAAYGATLKDLQKRASAVDLFSTKVEKDMGTLDSLLDSASPGSVLLINKPINALRRQFSDPSLSQLDLAAQQVGTEYERLITGGSLSVAQLHAGAQDDAKKLINGDMSPTQARAVMKIMRTEIGNARSSADESVANIQNKMRALGQGPLGATHQPTAAPPQPGQGTGLGAAQPTGPKVPAVGTVMQGFRFKGGNPADKTNWERVQ